MVRSLDPLLLAHNRPGRSHEPRIASSITIDRWLTSTPFQAPIDSKLVPRQSAGSCPSTISSGGIAGIVLGSMAGTLLLMWLWYLCRLPGAWGGRARAQSDVAYKTPVSSSRSRRRRRRPSGTYVDYVEKPTSSRRYRDDVRRPESVYLADR